MYNMVLKTLCNLVCAVCKAGQLVCELTAAIPKCVCVCVCLMVGSGHYCTCAATVKPVITQTLPSPSRFSVHGERNVRQAETMYILVYFILTKFSPLPAGHATGTSQHTVMRDSRAAARASGVASSSNGGLTPGYDVGPDCKVIILPQHELDKANKDRRHFPGNFQVCTLP